MQLERLDIAGRQVCLADHRPAIPGSHPPLLLVHGAGHDHGVWDEVGARLAGAGLHAIAPDLPGHGGSGGDAPASIDAAADWLLRLLDALGLGAAGLVGHSMGSLIALAAAARAPERVSSLVLVGSLAPMPVSPFLLDAVREEPARGHALINKFSFAPAELLGAERHAALVAANAARMEAQPAASLLADLQACNAWQDGLRCATALRCPALLVCGERDRMTPPDAVKPLFEACADSAGGARMITLAGAGHAMMDEAAPAVSEAIREFVMTH
ncbi:MAG: alpha/beta hydrolase [Thauera phenolivorans]|uniref:Alpha/beta hydrolase n=1 Tax=Thauera phenolivorans TaxID=1792543 RepID=A0A7X7R9S8_9RHOO|nr:alpha/beta hydrolase [Thauera phenolivorans]NLF55916.1 alpha/beta hydrolase [Thauera phenolivorans]